MDFIVLSYMRGRLSRGRVSRASKFDFVALKFPIIYLYCSTDITIYSVSWYSRWESLPVYKLNNFR